MPSEGVPSGILTAAVTLKLPREETVDRFSIVLNVHYAIATKIHLFFDDDPDPVVLITKPSAERQEFPIGPRLV